MITGDFDTIYGIQAWGSAHWHHSNPLNNGSFPL